MPHGKNTTVRNNRAKSYVARGRNARQNKFAKARTAVAKIQRKPYVPRVVKNTQSVYQLANAVKRLQQSRLGEYQKRAEKFEWLKTNDQALFPVEGKKPMCFCLNGFVDRDYDTGARARTMIYTTTANGHGAAFERFTPFTPPWSGINESVDPHWASEDDLVSQEVYQPLGTKVTFEFAISNVPANMWNQYIRIDIVKPRKILNISTQHHLKMPTGLGQFSYLAENSMLKRNFINPTYWKTVKTIWIPVSNNTGAAKYFQVTRTITRSYKNDKPFKPDLNASDPVLNKYAPFHDLVDPRDLEWCVISSSIDSNMFDRVSILRQTSWRDQNGTTA